MGNANLKAPHTESPDSPSSFDRTFTPCVAHSRTRINSPGFIGRLITWTHVAPSLSESAAQLVSQPWNWYTCRQGGAPIPTAKAREFLDGCRTTSTGCNLPLRPLVIGAENQLPSKNGPCVLPAKNVQQTSASLRRSPDNPSAPVTGPSGLRVTV